MKQNDLIVLGLAGVAVYMIVKSQKGGTATSGLAASLRSTAQTVSEIMDNGGKAFANGWRYFNDGTAIDPAGNYYQGGQRIWNNPSAQGYA